MSLAAAIAQRALVIIVMGLVSGPFGLNHVRSALAHGEEAPEAAKPADTRPVEPPLPPRPTEYPRGLNARPRPGEAVPAPPEAAHDQKMPEGKPGAEATGQQPMPAPVDGSKPDAVAKPDEPVRAGADGAAAKPAHWVPPKRYHFVMDSFTGLALGGNDPVAFFVDGQVRLGTNEHELDWGGTTWHFLNEGNLAAFKQNPEIYAPRFGGRCAFALSQGLLVEGLPQFYVIHRDRLYLFANAGNRAAFLTNPDALAKEAEREWPELTRGEP